MGKEEYWWADGITTLARITIDWLKFAATFYLARRLPLLLGAVLDSHHVGIGNGWYSMVAIKQSVNEAEVSNEAESSNEAEG